MKRYTGTHPGAPAGALVPGRAPLPGAPGLPIPGPRPESLASGPRPLAPGEGREPGIRHPASGIGERREPGPGERREPLAPGPRPPAPGERREPLAPGERREPSPRPLAPGPG